MFKSMGQTDGNLFFEKSEWFTPLQSLDSKKNGGISVLKGNKVVSIGKSVFFFIIWTLHRYVGWDNVLVWGKNVTSPLNRRTLLWPSPPGTFHIFYFYFEEVYFSSIVLHEISTA